MRSRLGSADFATYANLPQESTVTKPSELVVTGPMKGIGAAAATQAAQTAVITATPARSAGSRRPP